MDIMCRLRKSYPCRHQDEDDPRTKTTDTCVDSKALCLCELEDRKEAANEIERLRNEIERLRAELAAQNWQPIENAPKDRTDVLLLNDTGRAWVGWFSPELNSWEKEIVTPYGLDGKPMYFAYLPSTLQLPCMK